VLVYRTRVPAHLWYNPHERAALIARLESEDRCPIGYDESLVRDGVILLISVGPWRSSNAKIAKAPLCPSRLRLTIGPRLVPWVARLGSAKEEHAVKSLLLATALLGSVSVVSAPASTDLAKGLPGDGTPNATATVPLMLAKGSGSSGGSQGSGASQGSAASHGAGGYQANTGEGGFHGSGPGNAKSAGQAPANVPRTLRNSPRPDPPAAPPAGNSNSSP
jgi:hypothetical protein